MVRARGGSVSFRCKEMMNDRAVPVKGGICRTLSFLAAEKLYSLFAVVLWI